MAWFNKGLKMKVLQGVLTVTIILKRVIEYSDNLLCDKNLTKSIAILSGQYDHTHLSYRSLDKYAR